MFEHPPGRGSPVGFLFKTVTSCQYGYMVKTWQDLPALDEVLEVLTPSNILSVRGAYFILQLGNGL